MLRRSFLLTAAAGAAGVVASAGLGAWWRWRELQPQVHFPGRQEGHTLRERRDWPEPSEVINTDIVILGSGVAALTAAWQLKKHGQERFLMIEGPQLYGNAAGGVYHDAEHDREQPDGQTSWQTSEHSRGHGGEHGNPNLKETEQTVAQTGQRGGEDYAYPTGAHYLPLPSPESTHIREMLFDLGIILRDPYAEKPYYDERYILHGPEERLLINGVWQDGFVPTHGVPPGDLAQHERFFAEVERLRTLRGKDGKRVFVFPTVQSSSDPAFDWLDTISLKTWLRQSGYTAPSLHWYLNYCCRDDYGRRYDEVSAWAGLHYYCSRWGQAANAGNGAWLTWPGGLSPLAQLLDRAGGSQRRAGTAYAVKTVAGGVEARCFEWRDGRLRTFLVRARRAVCAMPLYVAARVVEGIKAYGFAAKAHTPQYAPWLVANFVMRRFPAELPQVGLCWDNVVYQEPGLGFVVSTHQDIRQQPPAKTVFTSFVALSDRSPQQARRWMEAASAAELLELASRDLRSAYGLELATSVERVDITLRGHAMAAPLPGFRSNPGLRSLRELNGPILFAHADLSGFSVFEEAAWWGYRAAKLLLR